MINILFPGRHHILTKFQQNYLCDLVKNGYNGKKVDKIIFAVTSANHANTRRNPIPFYLRCIAIERFCRKLECNNKICPINDVRHTDKFAEYVVREIFYLNGEKINKENTIVACSTPDVIKLFKKLGFEILNLELIDEKRGYKSLRPYEVIELLVKAGKNWRDDNLWKEYASEASREIYLNYNLGDIIVELFKDSLIDEDANITSSRDYNIYAKAMDNNVDFKFNDIKEFIKEGKIVDAGCGTGALVKLLAREFQESDIIGIEATRKFYEACRFQEYENPFVFFYRKNILNQNFKENTIDSFIYSSVLHEIYSYLGLKSLDKTLYNTYKQLKNKGRIIIRDVVGPENKKDIVYIELNKKDGKDKGDIKSFSTYSRFKRFTIDFIPRKIKFSEIEFNGKDLVKLSMQDAYEFISKMNYTDNWKSEMNEEFGFFSFNEWKNKLQRIGFKILEGSREFKSEYIIEKMYKSRVKIYKKEGNNLILVDYPSTNMVLVGEKN